MLMGRGRCSDLLAAGHDGDACVLSSRNMLDGVSEKLIERAHRGVWQPFIHLPRKRCDLLVDVAVFSAHFSSLPLAGCNSRATDCMASQMSLRD